MAAVWVNVCVGVCVDDWVDSWVAEELRSIAKSGSRKSRKAPVR